MTDLHFFTLCPFLFYFIVYKLAHFLLKLGRFIFFNFLIGEESLIQRTSNKVQYRLKVWWGTPSDSVWLRQQHCLNDKENLNY